ncbi:MAG: ABC transporter substrate-binding protein, partial [Candidatus Ventricola sp.]
MNTQKLFAIALALLLLLALASCARPDAGAAPSAAPAQASGGAHAPITIMSGGKEYSGFIEYVRSIYPEINIEVIPYRGANTTQYMYDQLYTGHMPDIYATTQMFTCYDKYEENLIDLSKYDFSGNYNDARISQYELDGKVYLLPADYDVIGMNYNATLFEREGWAVPASFAELEALAPIIKAAGYDLSDCAADLPGYGFQYLCNIADTAFLRSIEGIRWQRDFLAGRATATEGLADTFQYIQRWVDLGMLECEATDAAARDHFKEGNTAFFVGNIGIGNTRPDGTGIEIKPLPYLSEDGTQNMFITSSVRAYGLSKRLEEPGNEQKLEDALKVMELLSTQEGMMRIMERYETATARVCSLKGWEMPESSPFYDYKDFIADGHVAPLIYAGWENIMVDVGNCFLDCLRGSCTAMDVMTTMDAC